MALGKRIALTDYVGIDGTDLSNDCREIGWTNEHNRVDVSGFNPTGSDEFLAGSTDGSITATFYVTSAVRNVIYHLHKNRDIFPIVWREHGESVVSDDDPEVHGNVQALQWSPQATRGDVQTVTVTFTAADSSGLYYVAT